MKNTIWTISGLRTGYRGGLATLALAAACVAGLTPACAGLDERVVLATPDADASPPPLLGSGPDAGVDALAPEPLMCMATECPAPYATCDSADPTAPAPFRCQHNLLTDNDNCGACGNKCLREDYDHFGVVGVCFQGHCEPECVPGTRDCNGLPDDGCETVVNFDRENCGACGIVCPEGVNCVIVGLEQSRCGCPKGLTDCGDGYCNDLSADNNNCGACNNRCVPPSTPPPPNAMYACVKGECNRLVCQKDWADCNGDLDEPDTDGCEVKVAADIGNGLLDPARCGFCDVSCAPGVDCMRVVRGGNEDIVCGCRPNEVRCQISDKLNECVDLSSSPSHCGVCNNACPFATGANQVAMCVNGLCDTECAPGWADCNGNPVDGCETNIMVDGANCGACGNQCNSALGQPCVEGRCLMTQCGDEEPATQ